MTYQFTHNGKPHPQGRPKITTVPFPKVYYSAVSNRYRKELVAELTRTREEFEATIARHAEPGSSPFPFTCAEVCIYVWGLRRNADPDNMAKQVLDALVTAGVLAEDDWTHIPVLVVRCYEAGDHGPGIHVTITPTEVVP